MVNNYCTNVENRLENVENRVENHVECEAQNPDKTGVKPRITCPPYNPPVLSPSLEVGLRTHFTSRSDQFPIDLLAPVIELGRLTNPCGRSIQRASGLDARGCADLSSLFPWDAVFQTRRLRPLPSASCGDASVRRVAKPSALTHGAAWRTSFRNDPVFGCRPRSRHPSPLAAPRNLPCH